MCGQITLFFVCFPSPFLKLFLYCAFQYMPMAAAPQLGVASYKPDAISQVQPRGISMMVSGDTAVPYGAMMPQLTTLQVGNSVSTKICHTHIRNTYSYNTRRYMRIHTKCNGHYTHIIYISIYLYVCTYRCICMHMRVYFFVLHHKRD